MRLTLIAGSNRSDSASTKLLRYIARLLQARQIPFTFLDLKELPLPLYSPELGEMPTHAGTLQQAVAEADGLILATPEYHGSVSGVLKNAIDYLHPGIVEGKPVLSVSSAGGPLGIGSLSHLQDIVRGLHGVNCPNWLSIGYGTQTFLPDGTPADDGVRSRAEEAVEGLVRLARALRTSAAAV